MSVKANTKKAAPLRTHSNAHATSTRYAPTPHGSSGTSRVEGIRKGSHDGREQAADTDGEGEGRQVPELSFEDRIVAKLDGKLRISIAQVLEVDAALLSIRANHVHDAHALPALPHIFIAHAGVMNFGHGEEGCSREEGRFVRFCNWGSN